ncbi:unnamed protein product, partial [Prorocentrum cordatum]
MQIKKDVFGGNVSAAGGPSTRLKLGSGGGGGDAPAAAAVPKPKLERALQEARAEIENLKRQQKQQSATTGGNSTADMQVDGAPPEGAPPEEEQLAEKVKLLEQNLAIAKTGVGSWAEEQQRLLGQHLAEARQKLLNSKPLHTQVHALANRVKTGAAKIESAEAAEGYEVTLPSLGISTSELESIVSKLIEGGGLNSEAQKRLAEGLDGQINELIAAKKPKVAAAGGGGLGAGGQAGGELPGAGRASDSKPEWKPDDVGTEELQKLMQHVGTWATESELRERARRLAQGGFMVITLQEHHILDNDRLASFQREVADFGFVGIWAPALASSTWEAGAFGDDSYSAAVYHECIIPGRPVGARIHWGVKGGLVALLIYLVDSDLGMRVRLPVVPRGIAASTPIGCSRSVGDWAPALAAIRSVSGAQDLPPAWDKVLATVEDELLDRRDVVGPGRKQYQGRAGEVVTELKTVKWVPLGRCARLGPQALAMQVAARWANRPVGVRACIQRSLNELHLSELPCPRSPTTF